MLSKVVRVHETGGPEQLRIEELAVGDPGAGEVRIRVRAIGLNRSEALFRAGVYLGQPKFPSLMGYEASGEIEALGAGVQGFAVGERVCVLPNYRLGEYGVYAERAIVPARSLLAPPPGLTPVESASIWMQYFTAMAVTEVAQVRPGDHVIIRAPSSSVGIAAMQLCNWAGAVPIAATRTGAKFEALQRLGAAHVIATEESDLVAEVRRITSGKGARVVFDPVGGPSIAKLAAALSRGGVLFEYGVLSAEPAVLPTLDLIGKSLSIRGYLLFEITSDPQRLEPAKQFVFEGLKAGRLKPVVAKTFPLERIADAHRYLESNAQIGKIVVTV